MQRPAPAPALPRVPCLLFLCFCLWCPHRDACFEGEEHFYLILFLSYHYLYFFFLLFLILFFFNLVFVITIINFISLFVYSIF